MKLSWILAICLVFGGSVAKADIPNVSASEKLTPLQITSRIVQPTTIAEAAVMIDADTGDILFEKNPNKWMHPASLTKMVTLLTAIEKKGTYFDQLAHLSANAAAVNESELGFSVGDQLPIQGLAEGMIVVSGNDAAVAIAENVSGSVEAFVKDMNDMAKKAGATNSQFLNPHGLTQAGHHSTALDLARIAAYAMNIPMFRDMVGFDFYTVPYENKPRETVRTTNLLIRNKYEGINGVKTGYTNAAGDCLIASATRNGRTVIAVFLNDDDRWTDAPKFLDYGFSVLSAEGHD